jgi:hypothetical protein
VDKENRSVTVIECTEGSYEVQEVEFGKIYKWSPEHVVVSCDCGERVTFTNLETICGWCGADHVSQVQEELDGRPMKDEAVHPWRYAGDRS